MSLDLQRALKAPFALENWGVNTLISGILLLVPFANFIVYGQWLRYVKSVVMDKENLEQISGDHFILGAKFTVGSILLCLCAVLPLLIFVMLIEALSLDGFVSFILIAIGTIWAIFAAILIVPLLILFSMDEKIMTMVAFGRGINFITSNPGDFLLTILFVIVISIIYGIVIGILELTVIGAILIIFVMVPMAISCYNLYGQLAKETLKKQQAKAL